MKRSLLSAVSALILSGVFMSTPTGSTEAATLHVGVGAAFTTIQDAVDRADSGDELLIGAGTYVENVVIDKPLTVKSVSGPAETTVVAANADKDIFRIDAANVTLSGFTVYGADGGGAAGIHLTSLAANCRITDNRCGKNNDHRNSFGISLRQTRDNTVAENTCHYNTFGLVLSQSTGNTIKSNEISDSIYGAIIVTESDRNAIHANNCGTSHTLTEDGIAVVDSSFNSLRGNSCYGGKRGIVIVGSEEQAVAGNRVVGNNCNGNSEFGLLLKYVEDSVMRHNRFLHSGQHGVKAEYTSGNFFIANSLANSGDHLQLYYRSDDSWFSTSYVWYTYEGTMRMRKLGNYYGDYSGTDSAIAPDGVGSGVYNLHGYHVGGGVWYDHHPLATPTYSEKWGWDVIITYGDHIIQEPEGRFVASSMIIQAGSATIDGGILSIGGL